MNGRQDFSLDRSHLVASTMPGGLVMTAGNYGEIPAPFILPTSNGVLRTSLTELNRTPLALGLTSSHQQYHGRCNSSFSWNAGTHFSSLVNGFNFGSISSSVSPFHSTSAIHNIRNGWSSISPNSEGIGHYCMASGFCSLFPLVSGNEMYNSLSSASCMSRFSPFQQSFHHICHNSKGIQLDTTMAYPQHIPSTTSSFQPLTEDQNGSSTYYSKGLEASSTRGDLWSDNPKSICSDGNNNNTSMCVNTSDVQLINKHCKLPENSGKKNLKFDKVISNSDLQLNSNAKNAKHEMPQKKRKNISDISLLNSKQKLLISTKNNNALYTVNNKEDKCLESEGSSARKTKKKNQVIEPLFLERKLLIKKDSNDRWGVQPRSELTDGKLTNSVTTTTTATTTFTTTTATTIISTIKIPSTSTTATTTTTSITPLLTNYHSPSVPSTVIANTALDLSSQISKVPSDSQQHLLNSNKHYPYSHNQIDVMNMRRKSTSTPVTSGTMVSSFPCLSVSDSGVNSSASLETKTVSSNKKSKSPVSKIKNVQQISQSISTHKEDDKITSPSSSTCIVNSDSYQIGQNKACTKCKLDLNQAKKTVINTSEDSATSSLPPVHSPPVLTSPSSSVTSLPSAQLRSPLTSLASPSPLSSSSSSSSSVPSLSSSLSSSSSSFISTPSSTSSISPSYSTIAEDLWKASEVTSDTQCDLCDPSQIKYTTRKDSGIQPTKNCHEIQPKTVEVYPLKKLKITKGDTLILKPTVQTSQTLKLTKEQKDLPCSSKSTIADKRNNTILYSVENKNVSFKTRGKSLSSNSKTVSEKTVSPLKINIQKVHPIPVSSECPLQLSTPCSFTSVTDQPLPVSNTQIQYPLEPQPPKIPFNSATIITLPVNSNCISSGTSAASTPSELQPIGVCPPTTFSVQTVPRPLTSSLPLNSTSVPMDNINISDSSFLQTNKITQFESELKDNITVAQVLPVNVLTSNTCEKNVPVKMTEHLTENSVLLQNPTVSVNIPIGIAVARQRQEQTTTHTTSLVTSGGQWDDSNRTTTSISPPWITSSHTSTYWLPQGQYAASTTAPFPLQFNSPDLTHLSFPPVGFQLARDITGHLLLIPTNIDITDRSNIWPSYGTTATQLQTNQQCQQLMIQQPIVQQEQQQSIEFRLPVSEQIPNTEVSKTRATEIQTDDPEEVSVASNGETSLPEKVDEKEKATVNFSGATDDITCQQSTMSSVPSSTDESYPFIYQADSNLPYMYGSSGVLQFAQAVQTDSGKRSQGTSPLPNDDCLPTSIEHVAQNNDDSNSCGTFENNRLESDCGSVHNLPQVADASNQTETPPPTEDEDNDIDEPSPKDTISFDNETTKLEDAVTKAVDACVNDDATESRSKEVTPEPVVNGSDVIDVHGLQLLSNSIMEHEENFSDTFLNVENIEEKAENKSDVSSDKISDKEQQSIEPKGVNLVEPISTEQNSIVSNSCEEKLILEDTDPACEPLEPDETVPDNLKGLEGLGLLCALAEQRFVEENWRSEKSKLPVELQENPSKNIQEETSESLSDINYEFDNDTKAEDFSQIENEAKTLDSLINITASKDCNNDSSEFEMRLRLAELQKKYKEKQKQLAKLQPKKEKEEVEKFIVKRGPGRPRKHKFLECKNPDQQDDTVVTTLVKLEASPPLLETALDEPPVKKKKEIKKNYSPVIRPLSTVFSPLCNKVIKKSIAKVPLLKTKKNTMIASYLKKLKLRKTHDSRKLTKRFSIQRKEIVHVNNDVHQNSYHVIKPVTEAPKTTIQDKGERNLTISVEKRNISNKQSKLNNSGECKQFSLNNNENSLEKIPKHQRQTPEDKKKTLVEKLNKGPSSTNSSGVDQEFQFDNSGGLGLLANFACRAVKEEKLNDKNCSEDTSSEDSIQSTTETVKVLNSNSLPVSSCVSSSFASKKRKPGRPKKSFFHKPKDSKKTHAENTSKNIKPVAKENDCLVSNSKQDKPAPEISQPKLSFLEDEAWNRRRSERIFLNDLNVTPSTNHNDTSCRISSSPPHLKPVTEEVPIWKSKTTDNLKPPKNLTRAPDITKISKKSSRTDCLAASTSKKNPKECRKVSKELSEPENLFQALKDKCRLNDKTNKFNSKEVLLEIPKGDNNSNEDKFFPLKESEEDRIATPEPRSCLISSDELVDKLRVLALIDGLFYAGHINAIQAPDVYGITFDGERGNRPHIYSREEILKKAILEIRPGPVRYLSEGTRICAYWSQQYRCLYPGTVMKNTSPDPEADENSVYVEFDDGDSGRIPISDIRMLHSTFPIVSYGPSPFVYTGKRRYRTASEKNLEITSSNESKTKENPSKVETESKGIVSQPSTPKELVKPTSLIVHASTSKPQEMEESISTLVLPSVAPVSISADIRHQEDVDKRFKKIKTVLKHSSGSKLHKESSGTCDVLKSKKHKKHKDRSRSEEHRHHHHHHHHKHKHKHERYEMHSISEGKIKAKEVNNMKIIKTAEASKTVTTVVKSPIFTAERKKSDLTVKIRTNSTDLSHLDFSPKGEDSETQSTWDISEIDKTSCIDREMKKENAYKKNEQSKSEESLAKKIKLKKNISGAKRKKRPPSVESKSKMAAFLPARQLWRWAGDSFRRPGTKGKGRKRFYKAITRGKETIVVGDSAVFLSTGRPHLPYIGRIEMMWEAWGGNMVVRVKWFYHPEETKGGRRITDMKGALYQSPHVDENDVQTISHKCEVLSWKNFKQLQLNDSLNSSKYSNIFDNNDIYYLAGTYDPTTGIVTTEPSTTS